MKMLRSVLILFCLCFIGSNAQIKISDPSEMMAIEQKLIDRISEKVKLKNSHFHAIANELESFCKQESKLCGNGSKKLLKQNAADFAKISHLVEDRDAQRDLLEAIINFFFGSAGAVTTGVIDIIFLLLLTPLNASLEFLTILINVVSELALLTGNIPGDLAKPKGLIYNTMNSILIWSKLLGIDEDEMEEYSGVHDRRLSLRRKKLQEKKEMLTTIVVFSTYGYLHGGEDSLSSAQYGASAYSVIA